MELTTDVLLRGTKWNYAIENLSPLFKSRPHYILYMLSLSIGVMYDQRIAKPEENGEDVKSIPRNVFVNNDNGKLDFIFQAAILTTKTEDLDEEKRLDLAFGEKGEFKDGMTKMQFLTSFANFGVTKLAELVGDSTLESMEKIKNFLVSTVEGRNLEIDALPDDIFLTEE